jgi:ABC-2 type transport system ATP-binding protein
VAAELIANNLGFTWPGGFSVGPATLALGPGLHHLEGRNGAGKTTLLRCLCGALPPTTGEARLCGEDPARSWRARRLVGYAPAACDLPGFLTIDEAWQTTAALRWAGGWDGEGLRARLGLDGRLRLAACSAGQRRLAGLLAALAGEPPILLLDEPLANVDAETSEDVAALLLARREAQVVLLTSHEAPPFEVDSRARLRPGEPLSWRWAVPSSGGTASRLLIDDVWTRQ